MVIDNCKTFPKSIYMSKLVEKWSICSKNKIVRHLAKWWNLTGKFQWHFVWAFQNGVTCWNRLKTTADMIKNVKKHKQRHLLYLRHFDFFSKTLLQVFRTKYELHFIKRRNFNNLIHYRIHAGEKGQKFKIRHLDFFRHFEKYQNLTSKIW